MDNNYTYYAFISYQRKDEKWAKWLQRKLENYKLPVANVKEASEMKSKYIRPVFRDKTDLTAGPLPDALKEALQQSRYLIVICSPNAVQSPWVNEEIETFTKAGRTEYVIPFIVDGEPYSKDATEECFPNAIKDIPKDKEPLGVNIHENGKERAFIRTVAYMLNVKFDELWNRFERHRKKIRNITIACLAFWALLAFGIYDYTRTKVEYYADWVDCNGVAQGVIPLNNDQIKHRYASFKFEYTRVPFGEKGFYSWRLNRLSIVNSKGVISSFTPDNHAFFYPIQEYKYTDGYVTEIINRDTYNRVAMRYTIKDDYDHKVACLVDMEGKEKHQGSAYLSGSTTAFLSDANPNMSKIKRFHYTRNEKGYITKVTYHANDADELDESAIGDNNNIYGKLFDLDESGRVTKVTYINHEGNPMTDKYGVGYIRYNNASFECNDTTEYLGSDGKLTYNEHRFARQINKLDKYGNPIESCNEGADGKPCYDYKNIYRLVVTFDENGCFTEIKCYGFDGNLSYCSDNYAIQSVKYDTKGRYIEVSHYDINDKPCYIKGGYCILKAKYNSQDCIIEQSVYDIEGKPCVDNICGSHKMRSKYDEYNYLTGVSFLNPQEDLILSPVSHVASQEIEYDDYHQPILVKNYDEKGNLCFDKDYVSVLNYSYDKRGNLTKIECIDTEGRLCICKEGYATITYKYDNYGNKLEETYFGIDGDPIYINMCTSIQYDYYPNGLVKEERYYDENGKLCLNSNWFAISHFEWDNNGYQTKVSFFDTDTIQCYYKDGLYSCMEFRYDTNGNKIKDIFYDSKGNVSLMAKGQFAIAEYKYDNSRRIIEYSYFNEKGLPCYYDKDYHILRVKYDLRGNVIQHSIYGVDGKSTLSREGSSIIEYKYDSKNNITRTDFKDTEGENINQQSNGYSTEVLSYNERNQLESRSYYDNNGTPCIRKVFQNEESLDFSLIEYRYDSKGNITEYIFFDENNNLCRANGYAIEYVTYDDLNRMIEQKYKKHNGTLGSGGNHHMGILRYKYDSKSNYVSEIEFYDQDSVLQARMFQTVNRGIVTRKEIKDKENRLKSMLLYGFTDTKYAMLVDSIDGRGLNLKRSYYGEDGKLGNIEEGFATLVNTYDCFGRVVSQEYFDNHGKPVHGTISKYHKRTITYNKLGLIEEECFYDENGKYVDTPYLNQRCKRTLYYDERGILDPSSSTWYVSVDGKPIDETTINAPKEETERKADGSTVLANVELPGLFKDKGYEGTYCILEWNEWNLYNNITKFSEVFQESLTKEKHLLMVPLTNKGFGKVIDVTFPPGTLGVRLMDNSSNALFNDLVDVYEEYKKLKK